MHMHMHMHMHVLQHAYTGGRHALPSYFILYTLYLVAGTRSCENNGDGIRMLEKCAAWPASCISVVRPVSPDPTADGS